MSPPTRTLRSEPVVNSHRPPRIWTMTRAGVVCSVSSVPFENWKRTIRANADLKMVRLAMSPANKGASVANVITRATSSNTGEDSVIASTLRSTHFRPAVGYPRAKFRRLLFTDGRANTAYTDEHRHGEQNADSQPGVAPG